MTTSVSDPGAEDMLAREKRWTWDGFLRAYELGLIPDGNHYELLEGRLYRKEPQRNPHWIAAHLTNAALCSVLGPEWLVLGRAPVHCDAFTCPEPDVMVIPGTSRDWEYRDVAPADVLLAIEVSDTTLASDRGYKANLYARLGFAELWIVDVNGRSVEVRRGPLPDGHWGTTQIVAEGGSLAVPGVEGAIPISDVLPRAK